LEVRETKYTPLENLTPIALEIDRRDLPNRVGLGHVWSKDIGLLWLRRLLRRGRKYRMKVFAVAQEFEVNAWKIAGEGGLRRAFTVLYLGSTAYQALVLMKDKAYRERLRAYFDSVPYPCLVDVKGRFFPAAIPDLSGFAEIEGGPVAAPAAFGTRD
jgi:hypothetical protein